MIYGIWFWAACFNTQEGKITNFNHLCFECFVWHLKRSSKAKCSAKTPGPVRRDLPVQQHSGALRGSIPQDTKKSTMNIHELSVYFPYVRGFSEEGLVGILFVPEPTGP